MPEVLITRCCRVSGARTLVTADTLAMYYCNCVDNDKKKPGPGKDY